jgi:nucleotide-binding universal stress UspA family protein
LAVHVVDCDFVKKCVQHQLSTLGEIEKALFMEAKAALRILVHDEAMKGVSVQEVVCMGVPYLEINRKAVEVDAEMIILGSCGKARDMNTIFFGTTTEKVLRFITRPVLCVPPETEYRGTNENRG